MALNVIVDMGVCGHKLYSVKYILSHTDSCFQLFSEKMWSNTFCTKLFNSKLLSMYV